MKDSVTEGPPLRIFYSFPHTLGAPGIGTTALQQINALLSTGAYVEVSCSSVSSLMKPGCAVHQTMSIAGVRVPHRAFAGSPLLAWRYHDYATAQILKRSRQAFDIVHTWPLGGTHTLAYAHNAGSTTSREVPNTHTAHAYTAVLMEYKRLGLSLPRGYSHRASKLRLRLEEREYRQADALLVPSESVASSFLDRGFSPHKLYRHQYGYDPDRFKPSAYATNRPFTAIFVGSIEPRKGLHYGIRAWLDSGLATHGQFLICGQATDSSYLRYLQPLLTDPSIQVLGFESHLPTVMAQSDVLVLPSVEEGSALVTYEAQACGVVPLVSTAAGAHNAESCLLHSPGDIRALAEHLRLIARDSQKRAELRAACLAGAKDLTWRAAGQEMRGIFDELKLMANRQTVPSLKHGVAPMPSNSTPRGGQPCM